MVIVLVICGGRIAVTVIAVSHTKPAANHTTQPTLGGSTNGTGGTGGGNMSTNGTVPIGADHSAQWSDKIQASVTSVAKFTPSSTAAGTHPGRWASR